MCGGSRGLGGEKPKKSKFLLAVHTRLAWHVFDEEKNIFKNKPPFSETLLFIPLLRLTVPIDPRRPCDMQTSVLHKPDSN